ncbi:MAG: HD domain-containing phosphohydrolase, partial [Candidatus Aminicenantaceae bacterium]
LHNHKMGNMLKESEARYRSLVENAHDAIYISTSNGLQYANPALENLTDWKRKELCSKEFNFWNIVHPDDKKWIKEKKEAWKKGKEMPDRFEFRITTKNGEERIVEANTVNIGNQGEAKEMGILRDVTVRKKAEEELKKSLERYQKTFEQTINALVSALERRDPYTAGHQKRVANLAYAIAGEMDLPEAQVEGVRMAGLIHDVGKIQIPTEILIKPDHLSEIEFVMIKMHPQIGYEIVQAIEFPYPVAMIILQHHERMDGSGYPSGLLHEQILPEARILAVADIVEAMSSHRPYRPALGIEKALEEISKHKGFLYDSWPVNACLKLFYEKKFKLE